VGCAGIGSIGATGFLVACAVVKEGEALFSWKVGNSCVMCPSLTSKVGGIFEYDYFTVAAVQLLHFRGAIQPL
jgi:hypothetical protein